MCVSQLQQKNKHVSDVVDHGLIRVTVLQRVGSVTNVLVLVILPKCARLCSKGQSTHAQNVHQVRDNDQKGRVSSSDEEYAFAISNTGPDCPEVTVIVNGIAI